MVTHRDQAGFREGALDRSGGGGGGGGGDDMGSMLRLPSRRPGCAAASGSLPAVPTARPAVPNGPVRWGLAEALVGLLVVQVVGQMLGAAVFVGSGQDDLDTAPLWSVTLANLPLQLCMIAVVLWATMTRGNGPVGDVGLRLRPTDVPYGIVLGPVTSVGLGLIYLPILEALGADPDKVDDAARELTDRAGGAGSVILLVISVVILAPVAEELLFRGLVLRAIERRAGSVVAVVGSGALFGLVHFQLLQLPVLALLGMILAVVTVRSGRLGPAIVAHMAFNGLTVLALLTYDSTDDAGAVGALVAAVVR